MQGKSKAWYKFQFLWTVTQPLYGETWADSNLPPFFCHGFVTVLPWETSNRIFSYAEAYDWYTDYGRTGNVEAANHSYELYDEGSPAPDSFQESI